MLLRVGPVAPGPGLGETEGVRGHSEIGGSVFLFFLSCLLWGEKADLKMHLFFFFKKKKKTTYLFIKRDGIQVYLWLIPLDVWQKPTQYCKAITLQLGKKKSKYIFLKGGK